MGNAASRNNSEPFLATEDVYPSRNGQTAKLVKRHDPVVYAPENSRAPIASSSIRQFEEQGFMVLDNVFSPQEVKEFLVESARLRSNASDQQGMGTITETGRNDVRSVFHVHDSSPVFKKLASDERLAGLARYILNDDVYIHQSRLNYKPGFHGKEFYWHSDFETWHVEDGMPRMRALSISITLTENFSQNGPLMLIPGSHQQYAVCSGETPGNNHQASLKKQEYGIPSNDCLSSLVEEQGIVNATGKPGSVIVFDCNAIHGSNGNITPYPRANVFFVYNALSNKVAQPFCEQPPRPEHICTRANIKPISTVNPTDDV
ncbi:MAG: ectoine hydroxylase [Cycloclasticus sp.]|nr:ectoine hydroxylase [Cycloclasticus sp.]MBQ0789725.1 ectoine hydroxylase [Cycloclasticus sp.]